MKRSIKVSSKDEATQIESGLKNDKLKALTRILGILEEFSAGDQKWLRERIAELTSGE